MGHLRYKLLEIANWTEECSSVQIPALQRGLVWKPNQVELLWDSILRGFPIGSFMLSDIVDPGAIGDYYLMDGQQRYNAISIGFNTVPNARAVLWVDLNPPQIKNSTRIFWIKATTLSHPWGYKNDDECTRLNTSEKRTAIEKYGLNGSIYNNDFSLKSTWPIEAKKPIPLYCLLNASAKSKDENEFLNQIMQIWKESDFVYKDQFELNEEAEIYILKSLFPAFKKLDAYYINCNLLPQNVIENETSSDTNEQTTLEVLFTRLNTGGTAISKDDLNYSAIKAYWPTIKEQNDLLAEKYMNPAKLVMLSFRLALTNDEDDGFRKELTIKQIRSAARKPEEYKRIQSLYDEELERILWQVDDWLGIYDDTESKTPRLIRTLIARNSPDVYLLLMYLAKRNLKTSIELKPSEIKALAFCLHWFGNNKSACVQEMFYRFKSGVSLVNLQKGLSRLMHDCYLLHTYTPNEVRNFIKIEDSERWRLWNTLPAEAKEFFDRVFWYGTAEAKEMLLYAERSYLNTHFKNYDPAHQDMWAEYNRPWDYDHIIPRDWISGKWGPFREYDKGWLQSIGNMAAISYEANRSKSNSEEFSEYRHNEDKLLYFREFENIKSNITYDKGQSFIFAQTVYNRFCLIYNCVYDLIYPVLNQVTLSDTLQRRKNLLQEIEGNIPDAKIYFAASDNNDHLLVREQDWAREWIGIGFIKGIFMVCFEWAGYMKNGEPQYTEVGIRKIPGTSVTYENLSILKGKEINEGELNDWWYDCETCKTLESSFIIGKMKDYLVKIPAQSE